MIKFANTFDGSPVPGSSAGTGGFSSAIKPSTKPITGLGSLPGTGIQPLGKPSTLPSTGTGISSSAIQPRAQPAPPSNLFSSTSNLFSSIGKYVGGLNVPNVNSMAQLPFGVKPHEFISDISKGGLLSKMYKAHQWASTVQDPNLNWASPEKWEAAKSLNSWIQENRGHPLVNRITSRPEVQQQLTQYNSPVGQIGRTVGPAIGNFAKDPKRFAMLLGMPGIKELYQNTLGHAGIPGLAFAHSLASGNMKNWNTLTSGPVKRGSVDVIDHYIANRSKIF